MSRTKSMSLRLTTEEAAAVRGAAEALHIGVSALVEAGSVEAAHRLGVYDVVDVPAKGQARAWDDTPMRRMDQSASVRIDVSLTRPTLELLQAVAEYAGVTLTVFVIGATLRYIGRKKGAHPSDRKLSAIAVPSQYSITTLQSEESNRKGRS